ncbi:MAG: hypothetical protein KDA71_07060, partial [Planctomycetales bacterium]|nr:hypothetical protein [Planctomycetales bacterium]
MALFKKKTTRYLRPDGKQCSKGTPDASKVSCESTRWYGSFNDKGRPCQVPLLESHDASQTLLSLYHQLGGHLAGEVAKQLPLDATSDKVFQVGIEVRDRVRDLANDPYARHHTRPIGEHVEDFRTHL